MEFFSVDAFALGKILNVSCYVYEENRKIWRAREVRQRLCLENFPNEANKDEPPRREEERSRVGMRLAWPSSAKRVKYPLHLSTRWLTKRRTSTRTRSSAKDIFAE